jgi:nicotinamide mononucleotide adenylyltransferase
LPHKKYALFIGRYQTLHEGHKYLFRKKLNEGSPVLVAIRDMPTDGQNPYTAKEVIEFFYKDQETLQWINDGIMDIMIIPDIEGVYYGRDVGYKIEQMEVPQEVAEISATKLREEKKMRGEL